MISEKLHKAISIYRDSVSADEGVLLTPLRTALVSAIEAEIAARVAESDKVAAKIIDGLQAKLAEAKAAIPAPEHRPFDEAAARAGEAIQWEKTSGRWVQMKFIGMLPDGDVAVHSDDLGLSSLPVQCVRMAPIPMRTVWLNESEEFLRGFDSEEIARDVASRNEERHFRYIAYPVQVPAK